MRQLCIGKGHTAYSAAEMQKVGWKRGVEGDVWPIDLPDMVIYIYMYIIIHKLQGRRD